jgi:hypothetical protein
MPQLHLYLPKDMAEEVKRRARAKRVSVSSYIAELLQRHIADDWPEDFFTKVVGGWQAKPLKRPPQSKFEVREKTGS